MCFREGSGKTRTNGTDRRALRNLRAVQRELRNGQARRRARKNGIDRKDRTDAGAKSGRTMDGIHEAGGF